jgi:hypothetical protein
LRTAHDAFLAAATQAAMVSREQAWALLAAAARQLLDLALRFSDAAQVREPA